MTLLSVVGSCRPVRLSTLMLMDCRPLIMVTKGSNIFYLEMYDSITGPIYCPPFFAENVECDANCRIRQSTVYDDV